MTYFKVLNEDGVPPSRESGKWHLSTEDGPGAWMPTIPDPEPGVRGYHLCRGPEDLLAWLGPVIWVAEVDGPVISCGDGAVAGRARLVRRTPWDERVARGFAADCAEHVLPIWEQQYPDDSRPRRAIETARQYAAGQASGSDLRSARAAAHDALRISRTAAWGTARATVRGAAWAAWAAADAADAARGTAVNEAANETADVARGAAARGAAWAAADAADVARGAAARGAANESAWVAVRAAAWVAELAWQADRLGVILRGAT